MPIDLHKGSATSSWENEVKPEWDLVLNYLDQPTKYIDFGVATLVYD
jgi:hypothetical protein